MRCSCHQEVIRELEELAAWCDEQSKFARMEVRFEMAAGFEDSAVAARLIITRRRASMQPGRYQETVR
jgi:hypothetical protein